MDQTTHLEELTAKLPKCCSNFLEDTGISMAVTTRITYAYALISFFEFLIRCDELDAGNFRNYDIKDFTYDDLNRITADDINKYLNHISDEHSKKTTHLRKVTLSSFYNFLIKGEKVTKNPVLNAQPVRIEKSDQVIYLKNEEQEKLLNDIYTGSSLDKNKLKYHDKYKTRDYCIISFILDTGLRVSEVNKANINDLNFTEHSLYIWRKGDKYQKIFFSDKTEELLKEYLISRGIDVDHTYLYKGDPIFVTNKNERLSIRAIQVMVKKYTESSIQGKGELISVHKLRSSCAMSFYSETNGDILALQKKLNHASLTTTNIYAKASDEQMQELRNWKKG